MPATPQPTQTPTDAQAKAKLKHLKELYIDHHAKSDISARLTENQPTAQTGFLNKFFKRPVTDQEKLKHQIMDLELKHSLRRLEKKPTKQLDQKIAAKKRQYMDCIINQINQTNQNNETNSK
jgi:heme oxygenase